MTRYIIGESSSRGWTYGEETACDYCGWPLENGDVAYFLADWATTVCSKECGRNLMTWPSEPQNVATDPWCD